ncbi:MAG: ABC transporter ATP-binding protein [Planctomycetaceae bacterium]|nr:MAG: ABC transporter ATP-binding protein [Planctomycetaceae bacterium]
MNETAISITDLHFAYGRNKVLDGVNLDVPQGSVFGFLGRNGAGKTTTIQILLGLLTPQSGRCSVGGHDPQAEAVAVRRAVGYVAEDQRMYDWMRVEQILRWTSSFYPTWDRAYEQQLLRQFDLPPKGKIKTLSKGQNTRLALLLALAHRPRIVILDDPTLSLDPIARKEFLRSVITLLQSEGTTVFFSSHLLYEIEPVADQIAILDQGRIIKAAPTDVLRDTVRRFLLRPKAEMDLTKVTGILDAVQEDGQWRVTVEAANADVRATLGAIAYRDVEEMGLNLDEIFEAYVIGNRGREVTS